MFGGFWEDGNMGDIIIGVMIVVLIIWTVIGGGLSIKRLMDWDMDRPWNHNTGSYVATNWFYGLSWGQIIMLSICFGPAWVAILPVWLVVLLFKRGQTLFNLLSTIGPRNH